MMYQRQKCHGCLGQSLEYSCTFQKFNEYGDCPCSDCLIKFMCQTPCKKFHIWTGKKSRIKAVQELVKKSKIRLKTYKHIVNKNCDNCISLSNPCPYVN
jgi:hypothetical protein